MERKRWKGMELKEKREELWQWMERNEKERKNIINERNGKEKNWKERKKIRKMERKRWKGMEWKERRVIAMNGKEVNKQWEEW